MIGAIRKVIKLWQGWQRIGSIWAWITASAARIWAAIAICALAYAAWQFRRAEDWAAKFRNLETDTRTASKQAATDQAAVNHRPAAASAAIAERTDHEADDYLSRAMAAARAYADAHRVQPAPARGPGHADLPGADLPASRDDGQGDAAKLDAADIIGISRADFDICTINSGRIAKVRDAAQALIAAGVAVKSGPD